MTQSTTVICCAIFMLPACADDTPDRSAAPASYRLEVTLRPGSAWGGLEAPSVIAVAATGDVWIADGGDGRIHRFDAEGTPKHTFGGTGDGPAEFRHVRAIAMRGDTANVFDANTTRYVRFSLDGAFLGAAEFAGSVDEQIAGLGPDKFVVASNVRWSMPPQPGATPWPLARVVDSAGRRLADIGIRDVQPNPLVASIANFMLVSGTGDGRFVWLAFLNRPEVFQYSVDARELRRVDRSLPFSWQPLSGDASPAALVSKGSQPPRLPFDVVTYGIASDKAGTAYVLTALESSQISEPTKMAIDIILPLDGSPVHRLPVDGHYSHIAVSPGGEVVYLLDASTGMLQSFMVIHE